MLKHHFVTLCLNLGIAIGKQAAKRAVLDLVKRLHPRLTEHPLIRLGGMGDGGYLVPDDLEGIEACFSPGVSDHASFEAALIARGIRCYLADASVSQAPITGDFAHFTPKFWAWSMMPRPSPSTNGSRPTHPGRAIFFCKWISRALSGPSRSMLHSRRSAASGSSSWNFTISSG